MFNALMFIGVLIGIIFIFITSRYKNRYDKSVIYLNLVVLFLTLNNLQITLVDSYIEVNFFIRKLLLPWYLLIFPFFYGFIINYLKVETKKNSFVTTFTTIFIVECAIRALFAPYFYNNNNSYVVAKYAQLEEIFNALISLFLFAKSYILLFRNTNLYLPVLSFDNLKWLKNFMFFGCMVLLLWVTAIVFNLDKVINPRIFIYYPLRLSSSILLYWIGYHGFFSYAVMTERIHLRATATSTNTEEINTKSVLKDKEEYKESINGFYKLINYVYYNKSYENPDLTVELLAKEMNMSTKKMSQIIKENTNYSFPDFINKIRIDEAKKYIIDNQYSDYTIIAIALECGFHSKTTFYVAFKKFTNTTPTQFKKKAN